MSPGHIWIITSLILIEPDAIIKLLTWRWTRNILNTKCKYFFMREIALNFWSFYYEISINLEIKFCQHIVEMRNHIIILWIIQIAKSCSFYFNEIWSFSSWWVTVTAELCSDVKKYVVVIFRCWSPFVMLSNIYVIPHYSSSWYQQ